jgi:nucleoside-diphosphate-sugar epimerase
MMVSSSKQNILIVGSNGYIGSHIYKKYNSEWNIDTLDRQGKSNSTYNGDVTDINYVKSFVKKCIHYDAIIFLVGLAHDKGRKADYALFDKVNYQSLVNLMTCLASMYKLPKKIIFASTISVYGERNEISIYNEETETCPFSPYATTKLLAEQYLEKSFNNICWILRFAPVYSNDFTLNIDRRTKLGPFFYRIGKGNTKLSLCNIGNICSAVRDIAVGKVPPGIYNISDGNYYTYTDLLNVKNAKNVIYFPKSIASFAYYYALRVNDTILRENSLKLLKDNIYPSDKIRNYISLNKTISNINDE